MLSSYSSFPERSKGRLFLEKEDPQRDCYQRDRDRLIHSSAFRRLMYKTQVFSHCGDDHYRTRLTHSLEVAQIARSIARLLGLNEDLTETIALAHDIGHPPFAHIGEEALQEVAAEHYRFEHNAQVLRILGEFEHQYMDFDGLNLTWETIEGLAKHNGPIQEPHQIIEEYNGLLDLELNKQPSLEAQIVSLADDIAYSSHDIDDGLLSGVITYQDLRHLPIIGENILKFEKTFPEASKSQVMYKARRRMIRFLIYDVVDVARENIKRYLLKTVDDIRELGFPAANFSEKVGKEMKEIKAFLYNNLYFYYSIRKSRVKLKRIVKELFEVFFHDPQCLPKDYYERFRIADSMNKKAQLVCDFIANLTDSSAIREHRQFFSTCVLERDY
ncbi:deoxyguanosinetriphosphate triphosphohydrolase [Neorickettsia sennetsu]|uniref:Deoxyguanosinetriphosphate triphosphohydrolase-like protein n=1 Tax=Ehrlichia sennetsu (strain ATCC VR-367 / Miyayama) TaxID=222891 RepID=DGTL1_EHRS3|nr:deoxyguanosinetriphosphate triphosphohydrolase [Neorickettsia sennetsu]Q2GDV1.1 RecName: Full=Deoxyguanosinetriphosphate triphosphohydrolase-like protein [Neorickettsia sennetsu str. Miyayama]ABD46434.1 putative deoxyguanosinetriphosphate triphosphohydrolase [Neorickettsia sennetsu str. Miyayama]